MGLLLVGTVSCHKKKEDPAPFVQTMGVVDGTITPVGSIREVTLSEPGSSSGSLLATPDVTGYFRFANINAGTYNVSFQAAANYEAPAPRTVTVTADNTTSLGTIRVNTIAPSSAALRGSVSWTAGGTTYTSTTVGGTIYLTRGVATSFNLLATSLTGNVANITGLNVPSFTGPNLYRMENVLYSSSATYVRTAGGVPNGSFTTTGYQGLLGTLTVTAYDATARTLSGTFGFTAYDPAGSPTQGTDRISVSNGSFNLSY